MIISDEVLALLENAGAVMRGRHFVYRSGRHGSAYVDMDRLFPQVGAVRRLCEGLIKPFAGRFDAVAAPATGGIVLAVQSALAANEAAAAVLAGRFDGSPTPPREVIALWADKTPDGGFAFSRAGYAAALRGRRVLVVEDLLTTGSTAAAVVREARRHGGHVIGVSAIVSRGGVTRTNVGDPPELRLLAEVDFRATTTRECPLCAEGVPIVEDIGHGAEYRATRRPYAGGFVRLSAT